MGQKIHPHGLRVGINRKWNGTWFAEGNEWKDLFFHQKQVEQFFKTFFYLYPYTKMSTTKRLLLVDLKMFKYSSRFLFLFIFFYKMRTKRRKELYRIPRWNKFLKNKKRKRKLRVLKGFRYYLKLYIKKQVKFFLKTTKLDLKSKVINNRKLKVNTNKPINNGKVDTNKNNYQSTNFNQKYKTKKGTFNKNINKSKKNANNMYNNAKIDLKTNIKDPEKNKDKDLNIKHNAKSSTTKSEKPRFL